MHRIGGRGQQNPRASMGGLEMASIPCTSVVGGFCHGKNLRGGGTPLPLRKPRGNGPKILGGTDYLGDLELNLAGVLIGVQRIPKRVPG